MPIHHIVNLSFGFDLLPTVQISLLLGCEVQEIPGCTMRLSIIPEQVKRILDVRHLLGVKTGFVIILCQTDDAVYRLAEDVARFEQQETETTDKMILPCNPIFEPCGLLGMLCLLTVQFGLVLTIQLHQFSLMVALHSLNFTLQPLNGFLVRGNLVTQILDFSFQLRKQSFPKLVTELGMVMEVKLLQPAKLPYPNCVTE